MRVMHRSLAETILLLVDGIRASNRPEDRKLGHDYLAALAPLLASATLGTDILRELPDIERLLGHTWLIDEGPFRPAMERWRQFRREYEESVLSGMTVNERLSALGTMESFDRARAAGDEAEMQRLLTDARVDPASIRKIIAKQGPG
jgi:hypothetical protein